AAGEKPDLAFLVVHALDAAHHPGAAGDLGLDLAAAGVDQPEMIPAVALRHPDHFARAVEPVKEALVGVVHEGLALLVDQRARLAGPGIDRHDAEDLVPALLVA